MTTTHSGHPDHQHHHHHHHAVIDCYLAMFIFLVESCYDFVLFLHLLLVHVHIFSVPGHQAKKKPSVAAWPVKLERQVLRRWSRVGSCPWQGSYLPDSLLPCASLTTINCTIRNTNSAESFREGMSRLPNCIVDSRRGDSSCLLHALKLNWIFAKPTFLSFNIDMKDQQPSQLSWKLWSWVLFANPTRSLSGRQSPSRDDRRCESCGATMAGACRHRPVSNRTPAFNGWTSEGDLHPSITHHHLVPTCFKLHDQCVSFEA